MFYWENIIETPASYYDVDKFIFLGGGLCSPFSMTLGELYGLAEFLKGFRVSLHLSSATQVEHCTHLFRPGCEPYR